MLTRIISGLLLGFLFLLLALQSTPWVLLAFGVPHLVAQLEFTSLFPKISAAGRAVWVCCMVVVWLASCWWIMHSTPGAAVILVATLLAGWVQISEAIQYEQSAGKSGKFSTLAQVAFSCCSIALPFALMTAIAAEASGFPFLLLLLGAAWAADTSAVFSGKYFGKTPLVPKLSPKKTVEGAVGGILAGGLVWLAALLIFDASGPGSFLGTLRPPLSILLFIAAGLLVSAAGIFGDLSFSLRKRLAQVKDYGSIIPGHGGVLDRFDAMLLAAPYVFAVILLQ